MWSNTDIVFDFLLSNQKKLQATPKVLVLTSHLSISQNFSKMLTSYSQLFWFQKN